MSRTYKDIKRVKLMRYYKERWETEYYRDIPELQFYWLKKPGVTPKKRKEVDTKDHWMSTPSWWTHMTMIKPERRAARLLERKALISDLEDFDIPDTGRKPHIYYW